ncbi:MAG: hypothetical protein WC238_02010 [Parcubacteria group bacterium]
MDIKIKVNKKQILDFLWQAKSGVVKRSKWILIFLAVLALGYCGYLWYKFVARPSWSTEKRQEYVNATENKVRFDQKKFDAVIAEIERRKGEYNTKLENIPDIFRLK